MSKEYKKVLFIVWLVITVITGLTLIVPLVFSSNTVLKHTPTCVSKSQFNETCFLCGTTTAFTEISKGNFNTAHQLNQYSLLIYAAFLTNLALFIWLIVNRLRSAQIVTNKSFILYQPINQKKCKSQV